MKLLLSPFSFKGKSYLGEIYRPYVQVQIKSERVREWIPVEMIVDTGADYTLLPKRYSYFLGISPEKDCFRHKTYGVGGDEIIYLCKNIAKVKIGSFEKVIPVGFLDRDNIPALLGRLEVLEILTLVMKDHITKLEK